MAGARKPWIPDYTIKKAKIRWRNFAGREERYNAKGDRNFTIFLTEEDAANLAEMGLNVKTLPPREEGAAPTHILKVKVKFSGRPPKLVLVTHRGRTTLDEESAQAIDLAEIKRVDLGNGEVEEQVDLILSPYHWGDEEKGGIAVSLKAIYITIVEDELEILYGDIPEASGSLRGFEYTPDEEDAPTGVHFQ